MIDVKGSIEKRAERILVSMKSKKCCHKLSYSNSFSSLDYSALALNSFSEWLQHPKCAVNFTDLETCVLKD